MAARSRGPPRSRLSREKARRKSGACASARRKASRIGAASTRNSSESSRRLTASGSVSGLAKPLGEQAGAGGRDGQVDRRQKRAVARAAQGSRELEIGAGRGIDLEARPARPPRRGRERGPGLQLGALDVGQRERGGGDLGARERAEAVEGFDAIELADPAFRRRAVARRRARAASAGTRISRTIWANTRLVVHRLRCDDFARLEARDLR